MSKLRAPLRNLLVDESLDERELQRRAAALVVRFTRRRRRRVVASVAIPLAVAASLLLTWHQRRVVGTTPAAVTDVGPLALAGPVLGDRFELSAREATRTFDFTDGSRVTLAPATTVEVMDNDGRRFDLALRHGRATFDVWPGGPRRWIIEGGLATVEVVGTRFSVERDDARVRVAVEHGVVLVRGAAVPGGVQRLTAGQHVVVSAPEPNAAPPAAPVRAPPSAKPKAGKAVDGSQSDDRVAKTTAPVTLDDAVALADTARANGDLRRAVALLDVVAHQYPHDVRAALAAFTEARILADDLREPRTAAAAFSHALQMGLPASLAEDARARIVETFAAVHDMAAAREAADEYNRRHPNGRFRGLVQRWSGR